MRNIIIIYLLFLHIVGCSQVTPPMYDGVPYIKHDIPVLPSSYSPTWTNIHFDRFNGITQTGPNTNIWQSTASGGWDHQMWSHTIFSGNGRIRMQRFTTIGEGSMICLNEDSSSGASYNNYEAGAYLAAGGDIYKVENGGSVAATGVNIALGYWVCVYRNGSVLKIQTSPDGNTWTDIYTFTYSSTVPMYIFVSIYQSNGAVYPQRDNIDKNVFVFNGNSITEGYAASSVANRWTSRFCSDLNGVEANYGKSSTTMQANCGSFPTFDREWIPPYNDSLYAFMQFELGINDVGINDGTMNTTDFQTAYQRAIDTAFARGWPAGKIILMTPYYVLAYTAYTGLCGTSTLADSVRHLAYNQVVLNLAHDNGLWSINMFQIQKNRRLDATYFNADNLHPNDLGHQTIAEIEESIIKVQ